MVEETSGVVQAQMELSQYLDQMRHDIEKLSLVVKKNLLAVLIVRSQTNM